MEQFKKDFDGVFRFTNPTDEDFITFWNNKEYTYPAGRTVPIIIANETLENIQEIRKRFAYQLAVREFYKNNIKDGVGKTYDAMIKQGNKSAGGIPPLFDEKILEPMIESCLKSLPEARAKVKEGKKTDEKKTFKASKAISDKDNPNFVFKDEVPEAIGKVAEAPIN